MITTTDLTVAIHNSAMDAKLTPLHSNSALDILRALHFMKAAF